jgi:hypothetical protein
MTIMIRPSSGSERLRIWTDLVFGKTEIFFREGLDGFWVICPSGGLLESAQEIAFTRAQQSFVAPASRSPYALS